MSKLAVLTAFFNPVGYERPLRNYHVFSENLTKEVDLFPIELSFNGEFEIKNACHVVGSERNILWQKERLLNILLKDLPMQYDKFAWVDADVIFGNPNWHSETLKKLDEFPVVQLFESVSLLNKQGEISARYCGAGFLAENRLDGISFNTAGYAWAARREAVDQLMDFHIAGGACEIMVSSWMGDFQHDLDKIFNKDWRDFQERQSSQFYHAVNGKIGFIQGNITHLYHGSRKNRQYTRRRQILSDANFNPLVDLCVDDNGIFELCVSKSELQAQIKQHFLNRREDD